MSYEYKTQKQNLFNDKGQRLFFRVHSKVESLLKTSGAVRMQEAISGETVDVWDLLACLDRMVEMGIIKELTDPNNVPAAQHRVFIRK